MTSTDRVDEIRAQWRRERPDLDTAPMAVVARLHRLAGRLTAELVAGYRQFGLGEGEFDILATLRREGHGAGVSPIDLAERTMVTTGAVTKRLDRLEQAGWVRRTPHRDDGRGRLVVELTETGRALIDEAYTAHMANEKRLVAGLRREDRRALERLLRTWADALDASERGERTGRRAGRPVSDD
ncbi:MarR family winged helix-turn-helix transcriptional regulator [Jatrophihabitans endophyticus]|uniref:MarR family winged helix-turn-helix transcriptional regulator n=1 Tax=Jatrophihabitans endophyticus TaxID=1206085 RepID=UPI0009351457|nr:MarR family transcriptional regulator [Jatrophihabitans endophyticus]